MAFQMNSFPIQKGKTGLTTGTVEGVVLCVEEGVLTVTWEAGGSDDVTVLAGQAVNLVNATSATIISGTFHYTI